MIVVFTEIVAVPDQVPAVRIITGVPLATPRVTVAVSPLCTDKLNVPAIVDMFIMVRVPVIEVLSVSTKVAVFKVKFPIAIPAIGRDALDVLNVLAVRVNPAGVSVAPFVQITALVQLLASVTTPVAENPK